MSEIYFPSIEPLIMDAWVVPEGPRSERIPVRDGEFIPYIESMPQPEWPYWYRSRKHEAEIAAYWRSLNKTEWIAAARAELPRYRTPTWDASEPCEICGMTNDISEFHHVIPLEEQFDRGFLRPAHRPSAWLCPNHHAIVHRLMRRRNPRRYDAENLFSLTKEQAERIYDMISLSREDHRDDGSRTARGRRR